VSETNICPSLLLFMLRAGQNGRSKQSRQVFRTCRRMCPTQTQKSELSRVHSLTACRRTELNCIKLSQLRAYYNCDSSTIQARHATTRYEAFRAIAYEIDSSTPRESVVGVSCMLIDSSMHTIFTLYLYRPTRAYIVCVNMPEIVYTNATKCQYAEYTIIHCEIIVMLK